MRVNKGKKASDKKQRVTEEMNKKYEEIDWVAHYRNNTLKSLKVKTLNDYLLNNNLDQHFDLRKQDKLNIIQNSIGYKILQESIQEKLQKVNVADDENVVNISLGNESSECDIVFMNEDDVDIIGLVGYENESDSENEEQNVETMHLSYGCGSNDECDEISFV